MSEWAVNGAGMGPDADARKYGAHHTRPIAECKTGPVERQAVGFLSSWPGVDGRLSVFGAGGDGRFRQGGDGGQDILNLCHDRIELA